MNFDALWKVAHKVRSVDFHALQSSWSSSEERKRVYGTFSDTPILTV